MERSGCMSDVAHKWGSPVAQRGFSQVPNYLLLLNQFLDKEHRLSPTELLILVQLVGSWWKRDEMPFPSNTTLATRCGVSSRQVQRAMNHLEGAKLLRRVSRRTQGIISSNAYDLTPLVELLDAIAKAFPNSFPRNVDRETVATISAKLEGGHAQDAGQAPIEVAAQAAAEQTPKAKALKRPRIRLVAKTTGSERAP